MLSAFSDGYLADLLLGTAAILCYAVLGLGLLLAGYFAIDMSTPGHLTTIIRNERNMNATLLAVSATTSVALIVVASIFSSGGNLAEGLIATAVWGAIGVGAQIGAVTVFRILLKIDTAEIMKKPEIEPSAILLAATQIAVGLVTAVSVL